VVGLGVVVAVLENNGGGAKQEPPYQVAQQLEFGALVAQLVLAVLGVLVFTGEYGSGMIRLSIAVVPRRLMLLWAKLSVFSAVVIPLTLVTSVVAFQLGDLVWQAHRGLRSVGFGDPRVTRIVVGSGLVVAVTAICGLAIGAIIRSTAGSIATIVGIFFVLPILASLALPRGEAGLARFLPSNAGDALWGSVYDAMVRVRAAVRLRHRPSRGGRVAAAARRRLRGGGHPLADSRQAPRHQRGWPMSASLDSAAVAADSPGAVQVTIVWSGTWIERRVCWVIVRSPISGWCSS
jgi:ABC-2 type transport system permease protein